MKLILEVLLKTVLFGVVAHAVFVDKPERITLLPESASLVYNAIYHTEVFADNSTVMDPQNECRNKQMLALLAALFKSGNEFHNCYQINDNHVAEFVNLGNDDDDARRLQEFQKDINQCLSRGTDFYIYNCYVSRVQDYLQKIRSYVFRPNNSFEWNIQYQWALANFRRLTFCTGDALKLLMDEAAAAIDAFALC